MRVAVAARTRFASEARWVIGWLAQQSGQITLTEVSKRVGKDVATLSHGVQQLGLKAKEFECDGKTAGQS